MVDNIPSCTRAMCREKGTFTIGAGAGKDAGADVGAPVDIVPMGAAVGCSCELVGDDIDR